MPNRRSTPTKVRSSGSASRNTSEVSRAYKVLAITMVVALALGGLGIVFESIVVDLLNGSDEVLTFDPESDEGLYRQAAEENPTDAQAQASYANYLAQMGRIDEAIVYYERAKTLDPNNSYLRLSYARDLTFNGKQADAEVQFLKAIELDGTNTAAMLGLGELYVAWVKGGPRNKEAIVLFERIIALDPESFVAQRAREELAKLGVGTPVASPAVSNPATATP